MGFSSRLALDCYRDAKNVYKLWSENDNKRNKSKPTVKKV